jgi:hypothetical protein
VAVRTCIETPLSHEAMSERRGALSDRWQALTARMGQILFACQKPDRGRYSPALSRMGNRPANTKSLVPLVSHEAGIGEKFCRKRCSLERETGLEPASPSLEGRCSPFHRSHAV